MLIPDRCCGNIIVCSHKQPTGFLYDPLPEEPVVSVSMDGTGDISGHVQKAPTCWCSVGNEGMNLGIPRKEARKHLLSRGHSISHSPRAPASLSHDPPFPLVWRSKRSVQSDPSTGGKKLARGKESPWRFVGLQVQQALDLFFGEGCWGVGYVVLEKTPFGWCEGETKRTPPIY